MANESAKFMKNAYIGWTNTAGLYYAHDYDPEKVQKLNQREKYLKKKAGTYKKHVLEMSMIIPFTFICDTCGEFNYIGKKLMFKMEAIRGETQLGLNIYRFYGKCPHCQSQFTFKTDPESQGYVLESGGRRTYEHGQTVAEGEKQLKEDYEKEAEDGTLKRIEQAAQEAAEEMRMQDALEETLAIQRRAGKSRDNMINQALAALDFLYFAAQESGDDQGQGELDLEEYAEYMRLQRDAQKEARRQMIELELLDEGGAGASSSAAGGPAAAFREERRKSQHEGVTSAMFVDTELGPEAPGGSGGKKRIKATSGDVFGGEAQDPQPGKLGAVGLQRKKPELRRKAPPPVVHAKQPEIIKNESAASAAVDSDKAKGAAGRERSPRRGQAAALVADYSDSSE